MGPDVYQKFGAAEKKLRHFHKTGIPKVSATLLDLSADEAAKVVKDIENTYGKIYLLWDQGKVMCPQAGRA